MRVAVVAEWYPSPADPVLGIWAHRQAVAARDAGADVRVLAMRRPVPPLSAARAGCRALREWARRVPSMLEPLGARRDPDRARAVPRSPAAGVVRELGLVDGADAPRAGACARQSVDVVHAHSILPPGPRRAPDPRAADPRGSSPPTARTSSTSPGRAGGRAGRPRETLRGADLVLANSAWAERRCRELGGASIATEVVHLGADLPAPSPDRATRGRRSSPSPTSSPASATPSCSTPSPSCAPERRPDYLIIGDGPGREPLARMAAELGLDGTVRFAGQLPHEQALAEAARCHVFVMPGVEEPFGVAFVEAMAAGLPAIGARGEGGPEDIAAAGPGLLLVPPDDHRALAAHAHRPPRRPRRAGRARRPSPRDRRHLVHLGALRRRHGRRLRARAARADDAAGHPAAVAGHHARASRGRRVVRGDGARGAGRASRWSGVRVGATRRLQRFYPAIDLVQAVAARRAAATALARHHPRAVVVSTTTAALLAPLGGTPYAVRLDSPAVLNRPGRRNAVQHALERRSLRRRAARAADEPRRSGALCPTGARRAWSSRSRSRPPALTDRGSGSPSPTRPTRRPRGSTCWRRRGGIAAIPGARLQVFGIPAERGRAFLARFGIPEPRGPRMARHGARDRVPRRAAARPRPRHQRPLGGLRPGPARGPRRRRAAGHDSRGRPVRGARASPASSTRAWSPPRSPRPRWRRRSAPRSPSRTTKPAATGRAPRHASTHTGRKPSRTRSPTASFQRCSTAVASRRPRRRCISAIRRILAT